ncbi:hypothetical protein OGAPHI_003182 [Ogataea philodendri]|uniref:Amidohydrolase-related domain-containing protein n=1 Tax=Ogataea philodendri TaxID=1378263 RepID=A0A9P8P6Z8_9ASCO|nr:uncharacterized protein OGAPHI_003182 [Ogataea philodendri]KAH3666733.1 hypothetical protein OGAPHI_003182 [Ogataea philodendri]
MTKLVIENGDVLTLDETDALIIGGTVVIRENVIEAVHPGPATAAEKEGADILDATDQLVMPGLVDLHLHTAVAKGWNDHMPLKEYLMECWYPCTRHLNDDRAYWGAMASYTEAIRAGTTMVNDMFRELGSLAAAAERLGIRAVLSNDIASAEYNLDSLDDCRKAYEKVDGTANGRVRVWVGIEWTPLADRELLIGARALADELGTGIHIHLNESAQEVKEVSARFGIPPTELAHECGILGPDCVAAHCVHLNDHEIELMAETGTHLSHNPSSNAKLGNGIARVPEWRASGINIGLGHDAAECNNSRDMFEVMKFASLMHRAQRQDASLGQAGDILKMCCRNGNKALGVNGGQIKAGMCADVITLDLMDPMFVPLERGNVRQYYSHLVFAVNGSVVQNSIIDGRVVMRNRQLQFADERVVVREANRVFAEIVDELDSQRQIE